MNNNNSKKMNNSKKKKDKTSKNHSNLSSLDFNGFIDAKYEILKQKKIYFFYANVVLTAIVSLVLLAIIYIVFENFYLKWSIITIIGIMAVVYLILFIRYNISIDDMDDSIVILSLIKHVKNVEKKYNENHRKKSKVKS